MDTTLTIHVAGRADEISPKTIAKAFAAFADLMEAPDDGRRWTMVGAHPGSLTLETRPSARTAEEERAISDTLVSGLSFFNESGGSPESSSPQGRTAVQELRELPPPQGAGTSPPQSPPSASALMVVATEWERTSGFPATLGAVNVQKGKCAMSGLEGKATSRLRVMAGEGAKSTSDQYWDGVRESRDGERPPIDTADRFGICPQATARRMGVLGID